MQFLRGNIVVQQFYIFLRNLQSNKLCFYNYSLEYGWIISHEVPQTLTDAVYILEDSDIVINVADDFKNQVLALNFTEREHHSNSIFHLAILMLLSLMM